MDDAFVFECPVWTVVDEERHKKVGFPGSIVVLVEPETGKFIPLFTDDDLARRFCEENPGKVPLKLITPRAVRVVLEDFERIGGGHVGMDFSATSGRGRFYPVREIIDALAEEDE